VTEPAQTSTSKWVVFLGILTALGLLIGFAYVKTRPNHPEPMPEPPRMETPPAVAAMPPPEAEPEPASVAPEPEAESEPAEDTPPHHAQVPTVPASLVVSSMGANPSCVATCSWGDLAANGYPRTVEGMRAVVCDDGNAWFTSSWTKVEGGDQARCYTATGISAYTDDGPDGP